MRHSVAPLQIFAALALALLFASPSLAAPVAATTVLERRIEAADPPPASQVSQAVLDFAPGAWTVVHSHNGWSYNTVLAGEITLRRDGFEQTYRAGEGWVDDPGVLHVAGNQGETPARLVASFVVWRGLPPSTIVEPESDAVLPPEPDVAAVFRLNGPVVLAQPLDVVHQVVDLGPGATPPHPVQPSLRLFSVLDGSLAIDQEGERQEYAAGDGWAESEIAAPTPAAGESGARIIATTFVARGAASEASDPQSTAAQLVLPDR